jgi:predicted enzyme related to lactoylglutathione lyase
MAAPLVFLDIAAPDLASQAAFYQALFGWEIAADGGFEVPTLSPLRGTLRVEAEEAGARAEQVAYFGVPDITASLDEVRRLGGAIVLPRLEVPGVVVLALFEDPAGNRLGLIELEDGRPRVP